MKIIIFLFILMIFQLSSYAQYVGIEKIDEKKSKNGTQKKRVIIREYISLDFLSGNQIL